MADISKINAVALANIAKLDAVTAANIAKVNGLVFSTAPAFVGLLDETYGSGAAAAYSTRRLASATTVLLRVRRDTGTGGAEDDDEADVAYDSNNEISLDSAISNTSAGVTATTLGQFLNVGTVNGTTYTNPDNLTVTASCFVDTWYDQAGSNDAEQATQGSQPQIHNGTVNTDLIQENGKPAVEFASDYIATPAFSTPISQPTTYFITVNKTNHSGYLFERSAGTGRQAQGDSTWVFAGSVANGFYPTADLGSQRLFTALFDGASSISRMNSVATGSGNPGTQGQGGLQIGRPTQSLTAKVQEFIIYGADQTSNFTAIEVNINNHFAIGNLPNPTSGLLFDYPDAAAAYSVRQLSNTAPLSMRVRRDTAGGTGDDDEADVLFDFTLTDPTISLDSRINNASTGVASTTLGEFLNATGYTDVDSLGTVADGFCDTWYDQSGAGNDAEQTTFGNQPQIFDSASPTDLITVNGKPTIYQGGLQSATITPLAQPNTAFVVNKLDSLKGAVLLDGKTSGNRNLINHGGGPVQIGMYAGSTTVRNTPSDLNQRLYSVLFNGANSEIWRDGTSITTGNPGTASSDGFSINSIFNGTIDDGDNIQEFIFWNSDQDTAGNRSGIETNINTYFSIYT